MTAICVFCGASAGSREAYGLAARAFGGAMARQGVTLVYGGGKVGLMGAVADGALGAGGRVVGVIPSFLVAKELAHPGVTQMEIVESMHARKARMAELADAFVALPGGYGTLEEFCEILTWAQLGLHHKPVALLNAERYYDPLLGLFDHAVAEGFLSPALRALVLDGAEPETLLERILASRPERQDRWGQREREIT